jgi:type 1 fimbria pilin
MFDRLRRMSLAPQEKYQMRHLALFSGITVALLAPASAIADDTASLKVTGTISPASCSVSLVGVPQEGVQLDAIKLADFKPGQDLPLAEKKASLTIDCQGAAAQFSLKATDAQAGLGTSTPAASHYSLGFNEQGKKPNGYFTLSIDAASMADNKYVLKSTDGGLGEAWAPPTTGVVAFDHDGEAFAFAANGAATEPASLATLTVPLTINAVLAKDPVVNEEVALAGQATIEILY